MTVAELIALLQERPQGQTVLVAFTPQGCQDDVDGYGSEPRVAWDFADFSTDSPRLGVAGLYPAVTVIYALDS